MSTPNKTTPKKPASKPATKPAEKPKASEPKAAPVPEKEKKPRKPRTKPLDLYQQLEEKKAQLARKFAEDMKNLEQRQAAIKKNNPRVFAALSAVAEGKTLEQINAEIAALQSAAAGMKIVGTDVRPELLALAKPTKQEPENPDQDSMSD